VNILFFGLNAFHSSYVSNKVVIANRSYNKVSLIGNGIFDAVHVKNAILSDSDIIELNTAETFGTQTVFLANFEGNLEAGNYTTVSKPITKWRIRRRRLGDFSNTILDDLDVTTVTYTDYLQANRTNYEYQVSPVSDDGTEGAPIISINQSDFFGWYLCSLDNETIYKFDMNIESDSIVLNMDTKLFEGFTEYPVMRKGKRKYRSGGLRTIPYRISVGGLAGWYETPYGSSGEMEINNELLRLVEDFISNGEPKILKNTSGDIFKVQTNGFSYQYMDTISEQPYTISFQWVQVGDGE
jgi:hypothetical protein